MYAESIRVDSGGFVDGLPLQDAILNCSRPIDGCAFPPYIMSLRILAVLSRVGGCFAR